MTELTIDQALQQAIEAHKAGRVQEADRLYTAILKAQPKHPDANHNMGVLAVGVGKVEEGLFFFEAALKSDPNKLQFWLSCIDTSITLEKFANANRLIGEAVAKGHDNEHFKDLNRKLLDERHRLVELDSQTTLVSKNARLGAVGSQNANSELPKDKLKLVMDFYNNGNFQRVLAEIEVLRHAFPMSDKLYDIKGAAYHNLKKYELALASYREALVIRPNKAGTYNNMGITLNALGDFEGAIEAFDRSLSINPKHFSALKNIGIAFKVRGELEKAMRAFTNALIIQPDDANICNNKGIILKEQGKFAQALTWFEKAIEIDPDYADVYNNIGGVMQQLGRLNKALNFYQDALSKDPNHHEALNNIGNTLKEQGNLKGAVEAYESALVIEPNAKVVKGNLATLLFESRMYPEAEKLFEQDASVESQINLLKCFDKQKKVDEFHLKLSELIDSGTSNAVVGSLFFRAADKFKKQKSNPFCQKPLNYLSKTNLNTRCDFQKTFVDQAINILRNDVVAQKEQGHLTNGVQTAGNIFTQGGEVTSQWENIIRCELDIFRKKFSPSDEGMFKKWPDNYSLYGWLVAMKSGGELAAHIHDTGWITGSIYINVPSGLRGDSGNLVVTTGEENSKPDDSEIKKSINLVTGDFCLFPASLLHYTIPFVADEERIVLAFDVIPKPSLL
ncbi:tetratricopeptide repeat protein [bacterium]|nr:tetratricopeptide repeat protein [bacterium]